VEDNSEPPDDSSVSTVSTVDKHIERIVDHALLTTSSSEDEDMIYDSSRDEEQDVDSTNSQIGHLNIEVSTGIPSLETTTNRTRQMQEERRMQEERINSLVSRNQRLLKENADLKENKKEPLPMVEDSTKEKNRRMHVSFGLLPNRLRLQLPLIDASAAGEANVLENN
jgi:hypothetical protein